MTYNKVCFFTDVVSGNGGAQRLIIRRCNYLNSIGIQTFVVVRRHFSNYILENDFIDIPVLYEPLFDKPFSLVKNNLKEEALIRISLFAKGLDEHCLIESQSLQESVWAEYVASHFKAKHIFYSIDGFERFSRYLYYPYRDFFIFKYNNREVYGITKKSVAISLDKDNVETDLVLNVPYDANEIDDKMEPKLLLRKDGYITFVTITRLDKQYLEPFINDVIQYCKDTNLNIYLIICGSSTDNSVENRLKKLYSGEQFTKNLYIEFVGNIKMGRDLFDDQVYYFGMGTAILNSASQKCASIVITQNNGKLLYSLFGRDTTEIGCCEESQSFPLNRVIESLINQWEKQNWIQHGEEVVTNNYSLISFHNKYKCLIDSSMDQEYYKFKSNLFFYAILDTIICGLRKFRSLFRNK